MKQIMVLLPIMVLFSFCTSTKSNNGQGNRLPVIGRNIINGDTVVITGTEKITLLGRSEEGVLPDLEGTWQLQSIDGIPVVETSKVNTDNLNNNPTVYKSDTVKTIKIVNGDTITTTEINSQIPSEGIKKITPPQGKNYHIPQKPSISFYGSNETYTGFTGCNRMSGRYKLVSPNRISFQKAAASTKMVCIGDYDETTFLDALHKVNTFQSENSQLSLMHGDKVVLVFTKK